MEERRPFRLSAYVLDLSRFGLRQQHSRSSHEDNTQGRANVSVKSAKSSDNKSSKIMFLLKKNPSKENASNGGGSKVGNSSSQETQNNTNNNNKRNSVLESKWPNPTIIRATASRAPQPSVKKKPPPRPPPPKMHKGNGCIPVIPLDPPSYEEVLQADAASSTRTPGRRMGTAPSTNHELASISPFMSVDQISSAARNFHSPLIDMNSPKKNPIQQPTSTSLNDLLELEDIFASLPSSSHNQFSEPLIPSSVGLPTQETSSLLLTKMDDDVNVPGESVSSKAKSLGLGPKVLPTEISTNWKKTETKTSERPVPKPRSSLAAKSISATASDVVGAAASSSTREHEVKQLDYDPLFGDWGDDPTPAPSIPPRPISEVDEVQNIDLPTPPLPSKPTNYIELASDSDTVSGPNYLSLQRSEPHGIALYDYTAGQNDELSFKAGDVITLIHRINEEWFYGCLGRNEGIFPRNFVEVIVSLPDDKEFNNEGIDSLSGPRCVGLFDFVGDSEEELNFHVGDTLRLVSRVSDHWLKGWLDGKAGLIPANFVRIIEDLPEGDETLPEAYVLHAFKAESKSELTCESGDVIKIIYPLDRDWVFAQKNEKIGLVPWTYLDLRP